MLSNEQLKQLSTQAVTIKLNDQITLKSSASMFFLGMYTTTVTFNGYSNNNEIKHTFSVNTNNMESFDKSMKQAIESYSEAIRAHLTSRYQRSRG